MNITNRFLESLTEFKNSTAPASNEIAMLDKSQATTVLNIVEQATANAWSQPQLKQQLSEAIALFDDRTMSKTIAGHILKEISE